MRTLRQLTTVACISLTLATQAITAVTYRITDLSPVLAATATPIRINNAGQIVGYSNPSSTVGFLYTPGVGVVQISSLGGTGSYACGINNLGQVSGDAGTSDGGWHAFVYTPGSPLADLGTLGGSTSRAGGINDAGQVVGYSYTSNSKTHAFLYTPGTGMTDLGTLGDSNSYSSAASINASGVVVGQSDLPHYTATHAFVYQPGTGLVDLGTLGGTVSNALAISDSGYIVGWSRTSPGGPIHAFRWTTASGMVDLGTLPGRSGSTACYVNNAGQAVGGSGTDEQSNAHAVLFQPDGTLVDLGTLGGAESAAYAINDSGQIVGWANTKTGEKHPVMWEIIPEPSSLFALLAGLAGFGAVIRRRSGLRN